MDLGFIGNLNLGIADDSSHVGEVDACSSLWCHTCTTAENIAIDISAFYVNFRTRTFVINITNLSCRIVFILVRIAESTTIYSVKEGVSIYGYHGTPGHGAGISSAQYTQDGEVRNTLGVVENRDGCL